MHIEKKISKFLSTHVSLDQQFLLGLSGGADSTVLFHLLKNEKINFGAAHIDHGWRKESQKEQEYLESMCQQHKIPFHSCRLQQREIKKNLEEEGRKKRYAFFKEVCQKEGYHGVMVAHHADDQAETVLKRVFEGATLRRLKGLAPFTIVEGLSIWRPLLDVSKKEILTWLKERKIDYFQDSTNHDEQFLRGRMRTVLLPSLSKSFGKEISSSLCRLGKSAHELDAFLEEILIPYRARITFNDEGVSIDLSYSKPKTYFEWKLIVHDFFEKERLSVSSPIIESIVDHLCKMRSYKTLNICKRKVKIHQGVLTLL